MSNVETYIPPSINFTQSAANKVWELIAEEGNPNLKLRVFITGGGCSGFEYGFAFEEAIAEDDTVVERNAEVEAKDDDGEGGESGDGSPRPVQLLVDPMSFQYLVGGDIDYKDDLEGARFVIRNPNAKTTCGCGSSFST